MNRFSKPGMEARFGRDGRLSSTRALRADKSQIDIRRGVNGSRRVDVFRPDHSRVVGLSHNRGYVERRIGSRPGFIARTHVYEGRSYASVYREQHYHGFGYDRYISARYYQPGFYSWAYNPWVVPIAFSWGWYQEPWYGYYGSYFVPAPVYPTASLWLTDYLLAANLRLAYDSEQDQSAPPEGTTVGITPQIRQAISEEVRRQLEAERGDSVSPSPFSPSAADQLPPALDPNQRLFVVSMDADVDAGGQTCDISPGDVIMRTGDSLLPENKVGITILTSKPGNCPANLSATIDAELLQEMHNQFRETLDAGLQTLADNQGKGGLPVGPPPLARLVAEGQASIDPDAAAELLRQQQEADTVEQDAIKELGIPVG